MTLLERHLPRSDHLKKAQADCLLRERLQDSKRNTKPRWGPGHSTPYGIDAFALTHHFTIFLNLEGPKSWVADYMAGTMRLSTVIENVGADQRNIYPSSYARCRM